MSFIDRPADLELTRLARRHFSSWRFRMNRRPILAALLAAGVVAGAAISGGTGAAAATTTYTVTDLGTLGYTSSFGGGLNAAGVVSGESTVTVMLPASECPLRYGVRKPCTVHPENAFVYSGGVMKNLGTLGGLASAATAINTTGTVVGSADLASGAPHAFMESGGVMTDLGTFDGAAATSNAIAINSAGEIVGWSTAPGGTGNVAFLYSHGSMTDLGTLGGGTSSVANGINNAGVVIGNSNTAVSDEHGFIYQNGTMTDLGTLGGATSSVDAINGNGVVTGSSENTSGTSLPFEYSKGKMTSLGTYNIDTTPQAINDNGVIVGTTYGLNAAGDFFNDAFIYQNGTFQDLNNLIPAGSGWELTDAVAVNDNGQILVDATSTTSGQDHALLLTPTS
jgi:probable HAF family extracellular repeat protein